MTRPRTVSLLLFVLDALAVMVVFNLVAWLRGLLPLDRPLPPITLLAPLGFVWIAAYLVDGYRVRTDMLSLEYLSQHAIALLSAMLGTLVLTFVVFPAGYPLQSSRAVIAFSFLVLTPVTLTYRRLVHRRWLRHRGVRSLVFVGTPGDCAAFAADCQRAGMVQSIVCAAGEDALPVPPNAQSFTVSPFRQVLDQASRGELPIEVVVLRESGGEVAGDVSGLVRLYFEGIPTYTLELFHQVYWRKIPLYRINQTWLFQEGFRIAREPVFERLKRVTDLGFAIVGLTLSAPVVVLGALAVWIDDGRPFFYSQNRIGRNGVPFRVRKLRTMRVADRDGDLYTHAHDQRITRVGRWLRATRLDEFPQLWNVLRGEMSLIGPRAEWDQLVQRYEREIPCYNFRHLVRPGITGWAQVNYPYGASIDDTLRKLEYDLYYIRHFSFRLDASIVLKTIHVMLFGKGR